MFLSGCFGVCHEAWFVGSCSAPCQQNGQQDTCKSDDQVLDCFLFKNWNLAACSANEIENVKVMGYP